MTNPSPTLTRLQAAYNNAVSVLSATAPTTALETAQPFMETPDT